MSNRIVLLNRVGDQNEEHPAVKVDNVCRLCCLQVPESDGRCCDNYRPMVVGQTQGHLKKTVVYILHAAGHQAGPGLRYSDSECLLTSLYPRLGHVEAR
jgi:hypothetical protein